MQVEAVQQVRSKGEFRKEPGLQKHNNFIILRQEARPFRRVSIPHLQIIKSLGQEDNSVIADPLVSVENDLTFRCRTILCSCIRTNVLSDNLRHIVETVGMQDSRASRCVIFLVLKCGYFGDVVEQSTSLHKGEIKLVSSLVEGMSKKYRHLGHPHGMGNHVFRH